MPLSHTSETMAYGYPEIIAGYGVLGKALVDRPTSYNSEIMSN